MKMTQDLMNQIELYRKQYDYNTVAFGIAYMFKDSHDYGHGNICFSP